MKFLIFMCFLLVSGISHNSAEIKKRSVLKRVVRSTIGQITTAYTEQLKTYIIANCVENGFADIEEDLRKIFTELEECVQTKKIYVHTKEEYLENVEECSKEPIKKVKGCLTKKQGYFPYFLLNMARKQVELVYKDREIITVYMAPCMNVFERSEVSYGYIKCLEDTSKKTNDSARIPNSIDQFCSRFLPALHCLTDIIDKECGQEPKVKLYSEDHLRANEYPCQQKYD
ncbi:uncharacterized protein [Diabrotica undecimpunctata]|uniref:uncharacterized protein n=1 Tax=Diabrotica undecimpunctata TaxID=50387 RepID=UPI003B63AB52